MKLPTSGAVGIGSVGDQMVELLGRCNLELQLERVGIRHPQEKDLRLRLYRLLAKLYSLAVYGEQEVLDGQARLWSTAAEGPGCPHRVSRARVLAHFSGSSKLAGVSRLAAYPRLTVGRVRVSGGRRQPLSVRLNRLGAYLLHGPAPEGTPLALHHPECRHSSCLRLACLRWGHSRDNSRDQFIQGPPRPAHLRKRCSPCPVCALCHLLA